MAQLQVAAKNRHTGALGSEKDLSMMRRGDVVNIIGNTGGWGRLDSFSSFFPKRGDTWPGDFYIIHVQGITVGKLRRLLLRSGHRTLTITDKRYDLAADLAGNPESKMTHQRVWRLRLQDLPAPKRNELQTVWETTISAAQLRDISQHKQRNVRLNEDDPDGVGEARDPGDADPDPV